MDAAQFQALLDYCRIEDPTPAERAVLEECYWGAVGYMEGAGVSQPKEGTPRRAQYDLCVHAMALEDFDLRMGCVADANVKANPAFRTRLNQLKLTEPEVSDSDTGEG